MAVNFSTILHPFDRIPKIALRIHLELSRSFISTEKFVARVNKICC